MNGTVLPVFDKALITVGLEAKTASEVIRELASRLYEKGYVKDSYLEAVIRREEVYPTGMATEIPVAMPHTDVQHCLHTGIAVGILKNPVEFRNMGDPEQTIPVRLVFLLAVVNPANQVRLLRQLVDFFIETAQLEKLLKCDNADQALDILHHSLNLNQEKNNKLVPDKLVSKNDESCFEINIDHPSGLHARPAAKFVQTASQFPCTILITNLENSKSVNAKSILGVLSLEVSSGYRVRIEAKGELSAQALASLRKLIENNFDDGVE